MMDIRQRKAVIALNNMAVSLVRDSRYNEAADTFKDALELMQGIASGPKTVADEDAGNAATDHCNNIDDRTRHCVDRASKRLARPKRKTKKDSAKELHDKSFDIQILEDGQCSEAVQAAICDLPSNVRGHVIRIDECLVDAAEDACCWGEDCGSSDSMDVHLMINVTILHNFATMCQWACWTRCEIEGFEKAASLRMFALRFFSAAYTLLRSRSSEAMSADEAGRLILLTILVLQNMMHISFQLSQPATGMQYYDKLCNQRAAYLELEEHLRLRGSREITMRPKAASAA